MVGIIGQNIRMVRKDLPPSYNKLVCPIIPPFNLSKFYRGNIKDVKYFPIDKIPSFFVKYYILDFTNKNPNSITTGFENRTYCFLVIPFLPDLERNTKKVLFSPKKYEERDFKHLDTWKGVDKTWIILNT